MTSHAAASNRAFRTDAILVMTMKRLWNAQASRVHKRGFTYREPDAGTTGTKDAAATADADTTHRDDAHATLPDSNASDTAPSQAATSDDANVFHGCWMVLQRPVPASGSTSSSSGTAAAAAGSSDSQGLKRVVTGLRDAFTRVRFHRASLVPACAVA